MSSQPLELLVGIELLSGLDAATQRELASASRRVSVSAGTFVLRRGDPGRGVYVVDSGRLKVMVSDAEGRDAIVNVMGPTEYFGELSLLDDHPCSADVVALEPCTLQLIPREHFRQLVLTDAHASRKLIPALAARIRTLTDRLAEFPALSVEARLARAVIRLARRFGVPHGEGSRIALRLSQQELGDMIGASRPFVNRQVRDWEKNGWVVQHQRQLVVLDHEALEALGRLQATE